jgi:hypothetical protein
LPKNLKQNSDVWILKFYPKTILEKCHKMHRMTIELSFGVFEIYFPTQEITNTSMVHCKVFPSNLLILFTMIRVLGFQCRHAKSDFRYENKISSKFT